MQWPTVMLQGCELLNWAQNSFHIASECEEVISEGMAPVKKVAFDNLTALCSESGNETGDEREREKIENN